MEEIITADHIDILQLAGEETPEFCQACPLPVWKTIHIKDTFSLVRIKQYSFLPALILDTFVPGMYGGTGKTFPLELALEAKKYTSNLVISGGINEENVQEIIEQTEPWGIDLSSSVEAKPGKKDPAKLTSFMNHLKTLSPVV